MTTHGPDEYWNWNWNSRFVLPKTLTIQLKTQSKEILLDNIYCHYWISVGADDCFTEHMIKTDSEGKIVRTQKQLIENVRRLGTEYDEESPIENFPIRFAFKVWSGQRMFNEVRNMENIISGSLVNEMNLTFKKYPDGYPEEKQKSMLAEIETHVETLKTYFPDIKQNRNQILNIREDQVEISDIWTEERDVFYELTLQL